MENSDRKKLPMRTSFKELAAMMCISYSVVRDEVLKNEKLTSRLKQMGWRSYKRFRKDHVLLIFEYMGFPDGYEWYENQ